MGDAFQAVKNLRSSAWIAEYPQISPVTELKSTPKSMRSCWLRFSSSSRVHGIFASISIVSSFVLSCLR